MSTQYAVFWHPRHGKRQAEAGWPSRLAALRFVEYLEKHHSPRPGTVFIREYRTQDGPK